MKKFLKSLLVFLFGLFFIPTFVLAEGEEENEEEIKKNEPIIIYEFYGDGCGYCAASFEWFESIEEEYGDYFDLQKYEVWGSKENSDLMDEVAEAFGDSPKGVPYIVIGEHTFNGFDESDGTTLLELIMEEYEKDQSERSTIAADVIANFSKNSGNKTKDLIVGLVFIVIVVGVVFVVRKARAD